MNISIPRRQSSNDADSFYITFSDLAVILCVFFVMLLSMSKIETGSFERIKAGFSGSDAGTLVELAGELKALADGPPLVDGVTVTLADDGVRIDLDTAALFESGSAALKKGALEPFTPILEKIKKTQYLLDIEGHADDRAFFRRTGDEVETNWSLSGRRASTVVYELGRMKFRNGRLRIVGYASNKPKIPIKGKKGSALEAARAENRRVSLLVH